LVLAQKLLLFKALKPEILCVLSPFHSMQALKGSILGQIPAFSGLIRENLVGDYQKFLCSKISGLLEDLKHLTFHTPLTPLGPLSGPGGDALLLRRLHLVFERRHLVGVCARRGRAKFSVMYMMCTGREGQ
jgi:hypothetical protein